MSTDQNYNSGQGANLDKDYVVNQNLGTDQYGSDIYQNQNLTTNKNNDQNIITTTSVLDIDNAENTINGNNNRFDNNNHN